LTALQRFRVGAHLILGGERREADMVIGAGTLVALLLLVLLLVIIF
jgi:hypothetical protein